jgi:hypothetical protein
VSSNSSSSLIPRSLADYDRGIAYDAALAGRIRELVEGQSQLEEKKMFGGLAFLIGGNMAIAASGQGGVPSDPGIGASSRGPDGRAYRPGHRQ